MKRRPPDPPISMLIGKTVSWVVQSIRALAGTGVKANIEIGGAGVCLPRNPTGAPAHKPLSSTGAIIRASTVLHPFLSPPPVRFSLSFDATWAFHSLQREGPRLRAPPPPGPRGWPRPASHKPAFQGARGLCGLPPHTAGSWLRPPTALGAKMAAANGRWSPPYIWRPGWQADAAPSPMPRAARNSL